MSKAVYDAIAGQARKVKKQYAVMEGVTRKIKRTYDVVNGVTRLVFAGEPFGMYTGEYTVERIEHEDVIYDLYTLITSGTLTMNDEAQYWMCGGGGSGERYYGGGGGGYPEEGTIGSGVYVVTIGAGGGTPGEVTTNGYDGSYTSITASDQTVLAEADGGGNGSTRNGGSGGGGSANGAGTNGGRGSGKSTYPFSIVSLEAHCAGGSGGAYMRFDESTGVRRFYKGGAGGSNGSDGEATEIITVEIGTTVYTVGGEKGGGDGGTGKPIDSTSVAGTIGGGQDGTFYGAGGGGGGKQSYHFADGRYNQSWARSGAGYQGVCYLLIEVGKIIPIVITSQPQDVTAAAGDTVQFTVAAEGNGLTYQWEYCLATSTKWTEWAGSTSQTFTLALNTDTRLTASYRCRITDANGNVIYSDVVKVNVAEYGPIVITKQPEDWYGVVGAKVLFSVEATGEGLTYQWEWRSNSTKPWEASSLSGNKTNTITIDAIATRNGYQYRCLITDANGNTLRTDEVTLTLFAITKQPESVTAAVGTTVLFSVEATGEGLTYQWQYRPKATQTWYNSPAEGANTNTLVVPVVKWRDGNQYSCVITDANGNTLRTDEVTLTLFAITKQPESVTASVGDTVTFSVEATSVENYQWRYSADGGTTWMSLSGDNFPGASTNTVTFVVTEVRMKNLYRCKLTGTNGDVIYTDAVQITAAS